MSLAKKNRAERSLAPKTLLVIKRDRLGRQIREMEKVNTELQGKVAELEKEIQRLQAEVRKARGSK